MKEKEYMHNIIKECNEILNDCLFRKSDLDKGRVAKCMAEVVQTLSYFNGKRNNTNYLPDAKKQNKQRIKIMSRNIPTFKNQDGKYIDGVKYLIPLTNAVYKDVTEVTVDGEKISILSSVRTEDEWIVMVATENFE